MQYFCAVAWVSWVYSPNRTGFWFSRPDRPVFEFLPLYEPLAFLGPSNLSRDFPVSLPLCFFVHVQWEKSRGDNRGEEFREKSAGVKADWMMMNSHDVALAECASANVDKHKIFNLVRTVGLKACCVSTAQLSSFYLCTKLWHSWKLWIFPSLGPSASLLLLLPTLLGHHSLGLPFLPLLLRGVT